MASSAPATSSHLIAPAESGLISCGVVFGIRFDSRQMKKTISPMKMIGAQLRMNGSMCDHHDGSGGAAAASAFALAAAAAACCASNQDS